MNFRRREVKTGVSAPDAPIARTDRSHSPSPSTYDGHAFSWKQSIQLLSLMFLYFLVIIQYFERVRVKGAMEACQWGKWESWKGPKAEFTPHRVALIADPQLVDDHTYPKLPRVVQYILRKLSDSYLHVNYKYMQAYLDPDTTIFVGDLFDGGRDWEDPSWFAEYERFNRIFPEKVNRRSYRGLPGNHDIGFQTISYDNLKRFAAFFGESNDYFVLGNHTFIQLDTISYSHEDPQIHREAREFYQTCKSEIDPALPRIMLSHVPFYRDPGVESCGPGRESKRPFPLMRGVQYQTVIDFQYIEPFLKDIQPVLVLSGDDHDYCDMMHVDYADNTRTLGREISLKTASMTNGIRYPAVHLLSLNNPTELHPRGQVHHQQSGQSYQDHMCYMPTPYANVKVYVASLVACFAFLYVWVFHPRRARSPWATPAILPHSSKAVRPAAHGNVYAVHCGALMGYVLVVLAYYHRI